jgi:hypothetical protein
MDKHLKCFKTLERRKDWQQEATTVEAVNTKYGPDFPKVPGRKLDLLITHKDEDCCLKLSVRDRGKTESKPIVLIDLPMAGDSGVDLRVIWVEKGYSVTNTLLKILGDWLCAPVSDEPGATTNSDAIHNWLLWEIDI